MGRARVQGCERAAFPARRPRRRMARDLQPRRRPRSRPRRRPRQCRAVEWQGMQSSAVKLEVGLDGAGGQHSPLRRSASGRACCHLYEARECQHELTSDCEKVCLFAYRRRSELRSLTCLPGRSRPTSSWPTWWSCDQIELVSISWFEQWSKLCRAYGFTRMSKSGNPAPAICNGVDSGLAPT